MTKRLWYSTRRMFLQYPRDGFPSRHQVRVFSSGEWVVWRSPVRPLLPTISRHVAHIWNHFQANHGSNLQHSYSGRATGTRLQRLSLKEKIASSVWGFCFQMCTSQSINDHLWYTGLGHRCDTKQEAGKYNGRAGYKTQSMMTSLNGSIFRVTGPLWGEFAGHRWILLTKASDAELWCFLWSAPEQTVKQTTETLAIWDAIASNYDVIVMRCQWQDGVVSSWSHLLS